MDVCAWGLLYSNTEPASSAAGREGAAQARAGRWVGKDGLARVLTGEKKTSRRKRRAEMTMARATRVVSKKKAPVRMLDLDDDVDDAEA